MRWTTLRKVEIIEALQNGHLTPAQAMGQRGLSEEELAAWTRDYLAHGGAGLRATKLQQYHPRRSKPTASQANAHRLRQPPITDAPSAAD